MGGLQSKKTYEVEREEKRYSVDHRKKTSITKKEDRHTLQLKEEAKKDILAAETRKTDENIQSASTSNLAENKVNESLPKAVENEGKISSTQAAESEPKSSVEETGQTEDKVVKISEIIENSETNKDLPNNITPEKKEQIEAKEPSDEDIRKEKEELLNDIMKAEVKAVEEPKTNEATSEVGEEELKSVMKTTENTAESKHVTIVTPTEQRASEENVKQHQAQPEIPLNTPKIAEKNVTDAEKILVVEETQTKVIDVEEKEKIEAQLKAAVLGMSKIEEPKEDKTLPPDDQGKEKTENKPKVDVEEISKVSDVQIIKLVEDKVEENLGENKLEGNKEDDETCKEQNKIKVVVEVQNTSAKEKQTKEDAEKVAVEEIAEVKAITVEKIEITAEPTKVNAELSKAKEENQKETNNTEKTSAKDEKDIKAETIKAEETLSKEVKESDEKSDRTTETLNKEETKTNSETPKTEESSNKEEIIAKLKEENQAQLNKEKNISGKEEIPEKVSKVEEENKEKTTKVEEVVCQKTDKIESKDTGIENKTIITTEPSQDVKAADLQESKKEKELIQEQPSPIRSSDTSTTKETSVENKEEKRDIQKPETPSTTEKSLEDKSETRKEENQKTETETKEDETKSTPEIQEQKSSSKEIHPTLRKIQDIEEEAKALKERILHFVGTTKDSGYLTLNEELIKNMIKLDDLAVENNDEIRNERKRVIKFVQECLSTLERNAEKTKTDDDSDSDE